MFSINVNDTTRERKVKRGNLEVKYDHADNFRWYDPPKLIRPPLYTDDNVGWLGNKWY